MHITTSFYNAMTRLSDVLINAMPGRGSYTLQYKVRVVTNTPNGPGKKTTQFLPRMKPAPVEPVQLKKYRIISEEFSPAPQRPNQTSTGARRDQLLSQSERKKAVDQIVGILKEHRRQKAEGQRIAASGETSDHVATSSSASRPVTVVEPPDMAIDRREPIPSWRCESEWSALAPVPKNYSGRIVQLAATQGKSREKSIAAQPSVILQGKARLPGNGTATSASPIEGISSGKTVSAMAEKAANVQRSSAPVILECHPKLVPVPAEIGQSMARQVLAGKLKIVLGTRDVQKPLLAVRSFSDPGSRLAAIVVPSVLRDTRRSLKSADARILKAPLMQKSSELDRVFARRRAQEAMAAQSIAVVERGSARSSPQSVTDEVDF
jgi:hypothetical protein